MNIIRTIDLWTEQNKNCYDLFNGAFIDGFENNNILFEEYKIIKNCNCKISYDKENINISNKHHAIVYYKDKKPVRLMVINEDTEIENCISIALNQSYKDKKLCDIYNECNIKSYMVDMKEKPIFNKANKDKELDVGSCDRWNLLYSLLKGSYTESDTEYVYSQMDKYEFIPDLNIKYELTTDTEKFEINHKCAFINTIRTRLIPIQENSSLTK